jgi:hypothetical protein
MPDRIRACAILCKPVPAHFQAKWAPVRVRKMRFRETLRIFKRSGHRFASGKCDFGRPFAFSSEVGTGSRQENAISGDPSHFQAKWAPVRVRKMRKLNMPEQSD